MPQFDGSYPYLSYITSAGDEIILSCDSYKKWWECYGRSGFAAPPLKHITQEYADGAMDTLAIEVAPRTLTIQMVVSGATSMERDAILQDIASRLIQVGHRRQNWGKLKIRKADGSYVYIDCAYVGGMEDISQTLPRLQLFTLNFYAGQAYFYDEDETAYSIDIYKSSGLLRFPFYFGPNTHFLSAGMDFTRIINLPSFRAYPIITVTGPAECIRFESVTTGRVIEIDQSFYLARGETITIDTRPNQQTVILTRRDGTEENGFNLLTEFSNLDWYLTQGDNEIVYRQTNNNPETGCVLTYQQRWLAA